VSQEPFRRRCDAARQEVHVWRLDNRVKQHQRCSGAGFDQWNGSAPSRSPSRNHACFACGRDQAVLDRQLPAGSRLVLITNGRWFKSGPRSPARSGRDQRPNRRSRAGRDPTDLEGEGLRQRRWWPQRDSPDEAEPPSRLPLDRPPHLRGAAQAGRVSHPGLPRRRAPRPVHRPWSPGVRLAVSARPG
jgi:hypothetical protein